MFLLSICNEKFGMDDEYIVEEFSDDDYDSSSSDDEIQTFLKKECGLAEVEDDFETEVDKVMTAHMRKLNENSKLKNETNESNDAVSSSSSKEQSSENLKPAEQEKINDDLFYDPNLDDEDEKWVNEKRSAYIYPPNKNSNQKVKPLPNSDAVLNCPACLSLLCLDCQRHDIYKTQYRAMFVINCRINFSETLKYENKKKKSRKSLTSAAPQFDIYNPVQCSVCNTEVAVYDKDELYHFFNVLASY
ncbi:E2F-associated phosphoprotein-like [Stegodyphus dumicola]|uniref:E2F-associated phosphoprotein-like n=1 Tax=Stegodyphus dumicola TaxID=202533 RepID=UPI0015ADAC62|nr:E2F-associated phosphoprotein-like [Stegodyphus dumicola]